MYLTMSISIQATTAARRRTPSECAFSNERGRHFHEHMKQQNIARPYLRCLQKSAIRSECDAIRTFHGRSWRLANVTWARGQVPELQNILRFTYSGLGGRACALAGAYPSGHNSPRTHFSCACRDHTRGCVVPCFSWMSFAIQMLQDGQQYCHLPRRTWWELLRKMLRLESRPVRPIYRLHGRRCGERM
jgi:hypothetical protein